MAINIENVTALVKDAYIHHVQTAFGALGAVGIVKLIDSVKLIYQRCPPDSLPGTLTVVLGITATPHSPAISHLGTLQTVSTHDQIADFILSLAANTHSIVEISQTGEFYLTSRVVDFDCLQLAQNSIVYRFESDKDQILAKTFQTFVPKVMASLKSSFAIPTFTSLEEALDRYNSDMVRETQCSILKEVWEGGVDGPRLILVNKPESIMRESLTHALTLLTRDTSVRPEHNTDETKPVDIKVEWFGSGASALIEIKWLGKSTAVSRTPKPEPTYTEYDMPRAQEGAKQLADYMDREVRHSNANSPRGYLVVFDARRRNLKGAADPVSKDDALHYENSGLHFNPDYSGVRDDFSPAYRFYMRPRQSQFLIT